MNSILSKCVDELKKETPRIDYVLGMLETLIDMEKPLMTISPSFPHQGQTMLAGNPTAGTTNHVDEEVTNDYAKAYTGGPVGTLTNS